MFMFIINKNTLIKNEMKYSNYLYYYQVFLI